MSYEIYAQLKVQHFFHISQLQYSSQVTSRVHALRGVRAREKLARLQGIASKIKITREFNYS